MCGVGDDRSGRGTRPRAVQTAQPGISMNFLWKSSLTASYRHKGKEPRGIALGEVNGSPAMCPQGDGNNPASSSIRSWLASDAPLTACGSGPSPTTTCISKRCGVNS